MSKTRKLPKLKKVSKKGKKHHYKLKDPFKKRKLAIHEGVNMEAKKTGKTKKKAAIAKKGRFNILRIYRRNKKVKECNILTHDMRYMDKKYGLGKTKNICGKTQQGGNYDDDENNDEHERKVPTPTIQQAADDARYRAGVHRLGNNAMSQKSQDGGKSSRKTRKKRKTRKTRKKYKK